MKRLKFIDISKLIAVLFVLVDHAQYYIEVSSIFMIIRVIWLSFFLQIFFVSAGITSSFETTIAKKNYKAFLSKKFRTLIIPYFIWCLILNCSGNYGIDFFVNVLLGTVDSLNNAGVNSICWFLPSFFSANIITLFLLTVFHKFVKGKKRYIYYCVLILLLLYLQLILNTYVGNYLFFGLKSAFAGSALIVSGILIKEVVLHIYYNYCCKRKLILGCSLLIPSILLSYCNMPILQNTNSLVQYEYSIWMAQGYFGKNGILFLITAISFSMSVLCLSMCLEKIGFLEYLGKRTLLFMMEHIFTHNIIAIHLFPILKSYCCELRVFPLFIYIILSVALIIMTFPFVDRFMPFLYKINSEKQ